MKPYLKFLPVLALIAVNLVPALGVIYWGWSLTALLVLYWMENLIVGVFNVPKMALSLGTGAEKLSAIIFFCFHYGIFWLGHGLFLFVFLVPKIKDNPNIGEQAVNTDIDISVKTVLVLLIISHLISFCMNFLRRDPSSYIPAQVQMFAPYGRVALLHIIILAGAALAVEHSSSTAILAMLIGMKIVLDVAAHLIFNRRYWTAVNPGLAG